jgi:hypothetical protein
MPDKKRRGRTSASSVIYLSSTMVLDLFTTYHLLRTSINIYLLPSNSRHLLQLSTTACPYPALLSRVSESFNLCDIHSLVLLIPTSSILTIEQTNLISSSSRATSISPPLSYPVQHSSTHSGVLPAKHHCWNIMYLVHEVIHQDQRLRLWLR